MQRFSRKYLSLTEKRRTVNRALVENRLVGRRIAHTEEPDMLKFLIVASVSFGLVGVAAAADLPHPQPVYQQAQVGKMPIGKSPIGKSPIGKSPIGKSPIVTRG
jgi:hypothetical protein